MIWFYFTQVCFQISRANGKHNDLKIIKKKVEKILIVVIT